MTALQPHQHSRLVTVKQFVEANPAFTIGGMRHLIFAVKHELEKAGAIVHFGRRLLIDESVFIEYVRNGGTRTIAGRAR